MSARASLSFSLFVLVAFRAVAAPTIDPQFSTHAVIERDKPIVLSGTAQPREHVSVSFAGQNRTITTDDDGHWMATFRSLGSGGPYRIKVDGPDGTAQADDIMIGDVWLCSGQSNM
ncbi:MAG TPA: 9-O-acetylesterase, partial [Sphingomicrobium sp.]|nr:9-O-acetylesterase [Sphingomicrobium sp.]